jgi:hypothetical protein
MRAGLVAAALLLGGPAHALDVGALAPWTPADAVALAAVDLGALRGAAEVIRALEGVAPGELDPRLRPLVGDATGAAALPDATVLFATTALDETASRAVVFVHLRDTGSESAGAIEAMRAQLDRWGARDGARWRHASGLVAAELASGMWALGPDPLVPVSAGAGSSLCGDLSELDAPIGLVARLAPQTLPPWSSHFAAVRATVAIDGALDVGVSVQARVDADATRAELERAFAGTLSSAQVRALLPGPVEPPTVTLRDETVSFALRVDGDAWEALVASAVAAIQSEAR